MTGGGCDAIVYELFLCGKPKGMVFSVRRVGEGIFVHEGWVMGVFVPFGMPDPSPVGKGFSSMPFVSDR